MLSSTICQTAAAYRCEECATAGPGDLSLLMPASFGEILLGIYTRDARSVYSSLSHPSLNLLDRYFGIIQAGYRAVLQGLPDRITPTSDTLVSEVIPATPPGTESPTTPHSHSRNPSLTLPETPHSSGIKNNNFTTVGPSFVPPSPSRKKSSKRPRDANAGNDSPPRRKKH